MDYGTDFLLDEHDDVIFTPDGDIAVIEGPRTIAQDINQELKIVKARLIWDENAGSSVPLFLNDAGLDDAAIIDELERVAIADARVDPTSVKARKIEAGKFRLDFTPLGVIKPETLNFDLERE